MKLLSNVMKATSSLFLPALLMAAAGVANAQSFYDDIYYDSSKEPVKKQETVRQTAPYYPSSANSYAATMPSADNYVVSGTRNISVDDYNRRGVFATDSLTADTTSTDFTYTRRIEQFYNPEIVSGSGDQELASIYYSEPSVVNVYVNTPSAYWGYDYFYPSTSWALGWGPYYGSWRWTSPWYWNSWYDPYWSWGWSWGWTWGPGWGWGPGYWGPNYWGPGYSRPVPNNWNPRHPGARRPGSSLAGNVSRPGTGIVNGGRHPGLSGGNGSVARPGNSTLRPGSVSASGRPGVRRPENANLGNLINNGSASRPGIGTSVNGGTRRPGNVNNGTVARPANNGNSYYRPNNSNLNNNNYYRPSNNNNNSNYSRPSNNNGGRQPSYNSGSFGGSRSSGSFGGGRSGGGSAGGRGRH